MIIFNSASDHIFFAYLAGRPILRLSSVQVMGDRSNLNSSVYHILSRLYSLTGSIADIHNNLKSNLLKVL